MTRYADDEKTETSRLRTFSSWPLDKPSAVELAKAGLVYTGNNDAVQCVFCEGILKDWNSTDDPWTEHNVCFPDCPFVRDNQEYFERMRSAHKPQSQHDYSRVEERFKSFRNWTNSRQDPVNLARAGFYYTGIGDMAACFCCEGVLKYWQKDDDPWEEHRKYFPTCSFLRRNLGMDLIVSEKNRPKGFSTNIHIAPSNGKSSSNTINQQKTNTLRPSEVVGQKTSIVPEEESPMVEAVMEMGYSKSDIERAFLQRKINQQLPFISSEELLAYLMNECTENYLDSKSQQHRTSLASNEDAILCKICMDKELSVTFQPCGHLVCCFECGSSLTQCPICREEIQERVRTRLA